MSNQPIFCDGEWAVTVQTIADAQALDRLLPPVWVTPVGHLILAILRADHESS